MYIYKKSLQIITTDNNLLMLIKGRKIYRWMVQQSIRWNTIYKFNFSKPYSNASDKKLVMRKHYKFWIKYVD